MFRVLLASAEGWPEAAMFMTFVIVGGIVLVSNAYFDRSE